MVRKGDRFKMKNISFVEVLAIIVIIIVLVITLGGVK